MEASGPHAGIRHAVALGRGPSTPWAVTLVPGVLARVLGIGLAYSRGPLGPPLAPPNRCAWSQGPRANCLRGSGSSAGPSFQLFSPPTSLGNANFLTYCVVSCWPEARVWLV